MSDKIEERVIIEDTLSDLLIKKNSATGKVRSAQFVEIFLGCIFVSVAVILSVFSSVLIQVFEVVPTNLVLVKSIIQLLLFTISNKANGISIMLEDNTDTTAIAVQGLLLGLAFICSVGAVRLLPLGDVFSIIFSKTVFLMLLMSVCGGRAMTKKKTGLTIVCMLGLILLIMTQTRYSDHQNGLTDVVNPLQDHNSSAWLGLGLAFMYNVFSSQAEVLNLGTKSAAGVLSFWSAVGGLVMAAVSSFFSSEPSLLSGAMPSPMQTFLLITLSISAIATVFLIVQAEKLVSKSFVTTLRSLEIPLGLLISLSVTNDYLPSYVGYIGVIFTVISCVVAQGTMEDEEHKDESNDMYQAL